MLAKEERLESFNWKQFKRRPPIHYVKCTDYTMKVLIHCIVITKTQEIIFSKLYSFFCSLFLQGLLRIVNQIMNNDIAEMQKVHQT